MGNKHDTKCDTNCYIGCDMGYDTVYTGIMSGFSLSDICNPKWLEDKSIVSAAVSRNGLELQYAPFWQSDKDIVRTAVLQNCEAFTYMDNSLCNDWDFVRSLVHDSDTYEILTWIEDPKLLAWIAVRELCSLRYINNFTHIDSEFVIPFFEMIYADCSINAGDVAENIANMHHAMLLLDDLSRFYDDRQLYLKLLSTNGCLLNTASAELRADIELAELAFKTASMRGMEFLIENLSYDRDRMINGMYRNLEDPIRWSYALAICAVYNNVLNISCVSNDVIECRLFMYAIWPDCKTSMDLLAAHMLKVNSRNLRSDARLMRFNWAKNPELATWFDFTCADIFNAYHAFMLNTSHANIFIYFVR